MFILYFLMNIFFILFTLNRITCRADTKNYPLEVASNIEYRSYQRSWTAGIDTELNPSPRSWIFASVSVDTCLQCFKVCMVLNLSNMWGSTLKIDTAQSRSFTETAPKFTVLLCEKRPRGECRICFRRVCTRLLLYFNANKPQSFFLFFFLQNTSCIRKPQVISVLSCMAFLPAQELSG